MNTRIHCTRCCSVAHNVEHCPYPEKLPVSAPNRAVRLRNLAMDIQCVPSGNHEISDGDTIQFKGFGELDRAQYRISRKRSADDSTSVTFTLTEVKAL